MTKLHLDTDLGGDIDDVCALAMLLKWPDLEITGITTVSDDQGRRAGYTRYMLNLAGRDDIPVAAGADVSLGGYRVRPGFPDETQYWPELVVAAPGPLGAALDLLENSIKQGAIVMGIGCYTNLALLERRSPGILHQANLVLMGGYIFPVRAGYPAWGNDMDWNIQVDVGSAQYVLQHAHPLLVPLTVTVETALQRAHLPRLQQAGAMGQLLARQAEAHAQEYNNETLLGRPNPNVPDDLINFQHDPLACAIALGWNEGVIIEDIPLRLEIKDSWLHEIPDANGQPMRVVTQVNGSAFSAFWMDRITQSA